VRKTLTGEAPASNGDERFLPFVDLGHAAGRFEPLHKRSELKREQTVLRTGVADDFQELFGADQHRFGLAVDCKDKSGAWVFQSLEHLWKISVKLTTTNEANARLRHRFLGAKIGREREVEEANRQEPPQRTMGRDKIS
jgi:hypothetical protein